MFGLFYTMFCYIILGFPLALCICFNGKMGIAGLWLGMTIACIILDVGFAMIISCPNWKLIADKMRKTLEDGVIMTPMTPEGRALERLNKLRSTPNYRSN